jgi:hypothetical protein
MGAKPKITMPALPEPPKAPDALPPPPQESPTAKNFAKAGRQMAEGLAGSGTMLTSRRGAGSMMPTQSGMKTLLGT